MALSVQALDSPGSASQRYKVTTGLAVGTPITCAIDLTNIASVDHASIAYVAGGVTFTITGLANGQCEATFSDGAQSLQRNVIIAGAAPPPPPVPPSPPSVGSGYYEQTCLADLPIFEGFGTLHNAPTQVAGATADDNDTGLQFNGSTQYCDTPFNGSPNPGGAFSVDFWVKPPVSSAGGGLVASNQGQNSGPGFAITCPTVFGAPSPRFTMGGFIVVGINATPGKWNYVAATYDGLTAALYVNGILCGTMVPSDYTDSGTGTLPILIGATWVRGAVSTFYDGAIDEVKFYDHALTIDRVLAHFAARKGAPQYPDASTFTGDYVATILGDSPIAYYRCDETSGALAVDRSGNGNDGAYANGNFTLNEPGATYDGDAAFNTNVAENTQSDFAGIVTPFMQIGTTSQFSVEAWVFASSLNSDGLNVIATTRGNNTGAWRFRADAAGVLYFELIVNVATVTASGGTLVNGSWNYVVATYDASTMNVYLNGKLVATASTGGYVLDPFFFNAVFGFMPIGQTTSQSAQFEGSMDECAFYPYALTASQVGRHYSAGQGPLPAPGIGVAVNDDRHYWDLRIYDRHGTLLDLPKGDVENIDVTDVLNGGSSTGTLTFRRDFNSIGAIAYENRALLWVWNGRIPRPINPTWAGYMEDIDQGKTTTLGQIVANMQGEQNNLNRGIVSENVNPGAPFGNPPLDAADYLRHLFSTYAAPGYFRLQCPPSLFPLLQLQFDRQKLASVIDTVTKTGRDAVGQFIVWRVNTDYNLRRTLLVQSDQNPNNIAGVQFKHIFVDGMCTRYKISTNYRDIVNVVLVEGGQDAVTGQTVAAVFEDGNSVAAFDPWEDAISVPSLLSSDACQAYGEVYLDLHANPQAQGEIELVAPNPEILAGVWVQCWENASTIKQLRIASVRFQVGTTRIVQTLSPQAPTPYLDKAIYKMGMHTQLRATSPIKSIPVNTQQNFVRSGGGATGG